MMDTNFDEHTSVEQLLKIAEYALRDIRPENSPEDKKIYLWRKLYKSFKESGETRESLTAIGIAENIIQAYEKNLIVDEVLDDMYKWESAQIKILKSLGKFKNNNSLNEEDYRIEKDQPELKIELEFCELLTKKGIKCYRQVKCDLGIADIVTSTAIFEVKVDLNLDTIRQAVSQLLAYQFCLNQSAKLYIIGKHFDKRKEFLEFIKFHNIKIIVLREDGKFETLTR